MSLRASLYLVLALCCLTRPASSQRRPVPTIPSSRAVSTLSPADSIALVEATVRVVLARSGGAEACIVGFDGSLGGTLGSAFVVAGRQAAAALPAAADSVGLLRYALLGVRDGDTATVLLRISGTVAPPSLAFWVNDIDYYFVRTDSAYRWQFVDRRLMSASDYVAEARPSRRATCLNERRN